MDEVFQHLKTTNGHETRNINQDIIFNDGSPLFAPSIKFNSTSFFNSNVLTIRITSYNPTPSMLTSFEKVGPFEKVTKSEMWAM